MLKLQTPITEEELSALLILAEHELRNPGEQAHFIIRNELVRRGLLKKEVAYRISVNNSQPQYANCGKEQEWMLS